MFSFAEMLNDDPLILSYREITLKNLSESVRYDWLHLGSHLTHNTL